MSEKIRPEDLASYREAQLQYRLAMAQVEILQLKIFHAYSMREGDQFNAETGIITRVVQPQKAEITVNGESLGEAEVTITPTH